MKNIPESAAQIKQLGFRVFINPSNPVYAFFSDGVKIGYVQGYYKFSSVHKPNKYVGTGFGMAEGDITLDNINKAFGFAPDWASRSDLNNVVKYKDLAAFLKAKEEMCGNLVEV
jgi:hypothetical protein